MFVEHTSPSEGLFISISAWKVGQQTSTRCLLIADLTRRKPNLPRRSMSQMTDVEHVASGEILWKRATNATR